MLQHTDIINLMQSDMDRVSNRLSEAAKVRYADISPLLDEIIAAGGKRLRPLLLLLSARAFAYEETFDTLITAAAGVELLHTASLVHDDTVDRAALRRGKPTLNSQLDTGSVILIGDYLFAQSAMLAADTGIPRVVSIFASTLGDICDGQLMEMLEANDLNQSVEQYMLRIYGKTGSLFAGAAEMGGVISRAPDHTVAALQAFGGAVGTAFQIIDDVLDLTGESATLGKPAGNDLRQGTLTLPVIYFLRDAPVSARHMVSSVVAGSASEVEIGALIDDIRSSGAVDLAVRDAEIRVDAAIETLGDVVPDDDARQGLEEFAQLALKRSA
ncbi:MAG: polyprenyl synthetase family protein [Thermomicrobiales bacterium]|nr:polyprenyl synthetase family protein [Thermomicrobiales bacterium]